MLVLLSGHRSRELRWPGVCAPAVCSGRDHVRRTHRVDRPRQGRKAVEPGRGRPANCFRYLESVTPSNLNGESHESSREPSMTGVAPWLTATVCFVDLDQLPRDLRLEVRTAGRLVEIGRASCRERV